MKTIVLHGFSGNATDLKEFVDHLQSEDAIAIDLPSFGSNHRSYEMTWRSYVDAVYDTIQAEVGEGQFYIIGHSHGAMVAFCLAAWYPDVVRRVTLICPVARGSWIAQWFLAVTTVMTIMFGKRVLVWLMQRPFMVDMVTYFSKRDCQNEAAYEALQKARRKEAELYSVEMFSLFSLIKEFEKECDSIYLDSLPVRVITADNDLLVSKQDVKWYQARIDTPEMKHIPGGHVAPVTQTEVCALACR